MHTVNILLMRKAWSSIRRYTTLSFTERYAHIRSLAGDIK